MIAQASPAAGPLRADPSKRVNYTLGLVLGVDEFQQDQLFHAAARRGHDRALHGYGTAWGLAVEPEGGSDPEIRVHPGVAVDPCGREICVSETMCVKLTRWLDRHADTLATLYPPASQTLPLAVILCYRECPSDEVPVPGEPCRSQEDAMAPSRIRASFELKLALRDDDGWGSPPAELDGLAVFRHSQPEERAVRAFGRLLARVQTTTDPLLSETGAAELMAGVRALVEAAVAEPPASPPEADDLILLPADAAAEILREAMRVWVTEVRPELRALESPGTCGDAEGECCVLLAEIDLAVTEGWAVDQGAGELATREDRRPYLLHTRLLQEWLVAGGGQEGRPDVDSFATMEILGPNRLRVWLHHEGWLQLPAEALTFVLNDQPLADGTITEVPWGGIRNVWDVVISQEMSDGDLVELRFDTAQVAHVAPPAEDDGAWTPDGAEVLGTLADELRGTSGAYLDRYGDSLSAFTVYDRIEGGDLEGEYKLPIVAKIQKVPVDPAKPKKWQYLVSDGAKWLPQFLPYGTKDLEGRYPACTVRGLQGVPLDGVKPVEEQYLHFDGKAWVPAHLPDGTRDLEGRYPACTVGGLRGVPLSNALPKQEQYLRFDVVSGHWMPANLPDADGPDLTGRYPGLQVTGLRGRPIDEAAPTAGQVLQFQESSPPGTGRWVPGDPAAGGASGPAGGDLSGSYPNPQVASLQGRILAAPNPTEGQILRFSSNRWIAAAPPSGGTSGPAGGDLAGTYPNPTLAAIQGVPVRADAPAGEQYLAFDGKSWVPRGAVLAPAGPYEIVAAGRFSVRGDDVQTLDPTYNRLALQMVDAQRGLLQLLGFPWDPEEFQYVVKGTWEGGAVLLAPASEKGPRIRLFMLDDRIETGELHLEVSRYPVLLEIPINR